MGSLPLKQSDAARWTKVAWAAAALAGAASVILFVLPGRSRVVDQRADDGGALPAAPERARAHPTDNLGPQNWSTLSGTMVALQEKQPDLEQWWRTRQAIAAREKAEQAEQAPGQAPTREGSFAPSWRYVGLLWNGRTPLAIMQVDGVQRLIGVGDNPVPNDNFVVESIDATKIVVSRGRNRYEIKREERRPGADLLNTSASVNPDAGVFNEQSGATRRAPRARNSPR